MSWIMHHSQSEEFASQAEIALRSGNKDRAIELFRMAAEQESFALSYLSLDKVRTLGITAVSAASLWFKAGEFRQVERIIYQWLARDILPEFATLQLQSILQAAWNEQLFRQSGIEFVRGEILVSVGGGEVVTGAAPLELVHRKVNEVSNIFYRTIEMLLALPLRRRGLPSREIQEQFRPWLLQAPPGSYQFAVRVQRPPQMSLFPDAAPQVEEITQKFLDIVEAASQETHDELETVVPDPEYRKAFLKLTRNLAPTGKTFNRLEIRSATDIDARPIVFLPESRQDINNTLREETIRAPEQTTLRVEQITGILRALHLDNDWIELHPDGQDQTIRIRETGDVIDDMVGPMVNQRVIVDVVVRHDRTYLYRDIQLEE